MAESESTERDLCLEKGQNNLLYPDSETDAPMNTHSAGGRPNRLLSCIDKYKFGLLVVFNIFALGYLAYPPLRSTDPSLALYSPVNDIISYKPVVFTGNRDPRTKYMPPERGGLPDDEVDKAWEDLYTTSTIIKVPSESAQQLVNWTSPIPGDESNYITMLDVFHQLHCLNLIRRSVYPERYHRQMWDGHQFQNISNPHLEHCIDSLRQLITCHSDVSTHYWRWEPWYNKTRTYSEVTHTCRDFDAIRSWASERVFYEFDASVQIDDPLRQGAVPFAEGGKVFS